MNLCILQVEILQAPQLRYTQDNNLAVTEMLVQFPGLRPDDPQGRLKLVAWGNLAEQAAQQFHVGDQILVEGRLGMVKVDLPGGSRTTRAELTAARIFPIQVGEAMGGESPPTTAPAPSPVAVASSDDTSTPF
ncbi:MAG: single-stranded DNA-binding protein [Gloeomargarita sp. HHBFW_bins_162]